MSKRPEHETERELQGAVLRYLGENPDAMDTLEGIAEWWVMRQHVRTSVSRLAHVLGRLVEDGLVENIGPAERPRYRLRRSSAGRVSTGADK